MTRSTLAVFDTTLQKTNAWLERLMSELSVSEPHLAYQVLRGVLHALRDRITVDEAAQLGAQMPMLVRGIYFEGWRPADSPRKERHADQFLQRIEKQLARSEASTVEPGRAARAVFALLSDQISSGEIEDVREMLPAEVRELWPA